MRAPDPATAAESHAALAELNVWLGSLAAQARVEWALATLSETHVISSSFGAQSAVALHMTTRVSANIPVIFVDTGYLFDETHQVMEALQHRLALNIRIYTPDPARAWSLADVAGLPAAGTEGLRRYNAVHKIEPMQRAFRDLNVRTWIAGLRRAQSNSRAATNFLELADGRWKVHPLADWSNGDMWAYLQQHKLPHHPLWDAGYVSIGDTHSTRRLEDGMLEEETRFFGLKRECGLHESWSEVAGRAA